MTNYIYVVENMHTRALVASFSTEGEAYKFADNLDPNEETLTVDKVKLYGYAVEAESEVGE